MELFRLSPDGLIAWMNGLPPEWIWVGLLAFSFVSILALLRLLGPPGLYVYIGVAVVAANLQVLKAVKFGFFPDPVALGTVLFASTYLCTDILAEYYGPKQARVGVSLGFAAMLLMTVWMMATLGFRPLSAPGPEWEWALENHGHLRALFTPAPALFVAGMTAYLISQYHDVWVYQRIRRLTHGRFVWLRNNVSTMISALIDNTIFGVLAWWVFAAEPMPWRVLIFTYILGTYGLRIVVALLDTPVVYLARFCLPPADRETRRA